MSLWGVHAGVGATVAVLLLSRTSIPRASRWSVVCLSATWAIVPDLYHFVPGTRTWYKPLVHDSPLANAFWFHGVIDRLDPGDRRSYAVATMAVFLVVFALAELRLERSP